MTTAPRNHASDLRGASRLAVDATAGVTNLVQALHATIAGRTGAWPVVDGATNAITQVVYTSIRGVTRTVGGGIDAALGALAPALGHVEASPWRDTLVGALNGVLGDYLADTANPLALAMDLRRDGRPLALSSDALAAAVPTSSTKIVLLVHGLCMNDRRWNREGHDHGAALARDLGYTPVYLRYNTGLHVSTNGQALALQLETLAGAWRGSLDELSIVAHSMGGLVARSACHYATLAGHTWPRKLRSIVFLGTPHHGAPLERGGHWFQLLLDATPYTAPFAKLGRIRSAGITDLRHGSLRDEDWAGHDRFARHDGPRHPVPLPAGVRCYAIAGTAGGSRGALGDGLVPVASALGRHRDRRLALGVPVSRRWIARGTNHLGLLSDPAVYERIRAWLAT